MTETQALERYEWGVNIDAGTAYEKMQRAKSGEWVRYEDVAAALTEAQRERDEARRRRILAAVTHSARRSAATSEENAL